MYFRIEDVVFERILEKKDNAKHDMLEKNYQDIEKVKKVRLQILWGKFKKIADERESDYFGRVIHIFNQIDWMEKTSTIPRLLRRFYGH